jgi:hypothetical protein
MKSEFPALRRARQRNVVRRKLTQSLHTCDSLVLLREAVVNVLCDWSDVDLLDPVDSHAETERAPTYADELAPASEAPTTESAPSVEVKSDLGREYGPGDGARRWEDR